MVWIYLIGAVVLFIIFGLRIVKEWETGLVFRFGSYNGKKKPGLNWIIPVVDKIIKVDERIRNIDVEPQEIMTEDSVPTKLNAVIYFKVTNSEKAILNAEDFEDSSYKLAQTALRDIVGQHDLDYLLANKKEMGERIKEVLQEPTNEWGVSVKNVEIKDVILPDNMKRAMAQESEAVREKRARKTKAEGEKDASKIFNEAAKEMDQKALTLRQLQTWSEIGAEQNTSMLIVPSEIISAFKDIGKKS